MKIRKISVLAAVISLMLLLLIVRSADNDANSEVDLGWYKVADWEVNVCRSWGGYHDDVGTANGQTLGKNMTEYTSMDIIATIQGGILEVSPGEGDFPDNTRIYEISWYIQPVAESVNYKITAFYKDGTSKDVESTSATPYSGYEGYYAENSTKNMTHAVLGVPSKGISLQVPMVENEE